MPSSLRLDWICVCGVSSSLLLQVDMVVTCRECGKRIGWIREVSWSGYVYVLSNPGIPDLLKVGFTMGDPDQRARELSDHTGVPNRYVIEATFRSSDPRRHEREIHERLKPQRHNQNREFFAAPIPFILAHCTTVTGFAPECRPEVLKVGYDPWAKVRMRGLSSATGGTLATAEGVAAGKFACPGCRSPMRPPNKRVQALGGYRWCSKCLIVVNRSGEQLDVRAR